MRLRDPRRVAVLGRQRRKRLGDAGWQPCPLGQRLGQRRAGPATDQKDPVHCPGMIEPLVDGQRQADALGNRIGCIRLGWAVILVVDQAVPVTNAETQPVAGVHHAGDALVPVRRGQTQCPGNGVGFHIDRGQRQPSAFMASIRQAT